MHAKRYSENYILKFPLIHSDKARQKKYVFYKKVLKGLIISFIFFIAVPALIGVVFSFFEINLCPFPNLFRLSYYSFNVFFILFIVLRVLLNKFKPDGTLSMAAAAFAINNSNSRELFVLDNVKNLEIFINKERNNLSLLELLIIYNWKIITRNEEVLNFIEFDYENLHYRYEFRLESESNVMLFERRIEEWKANYPEIIKK